jgi:hypothetical protein
MSLNLRLLLFFLIVDFFIVAIGTCPDRTYALGTACVSCDCGFGFFDVNCGGFNRGECIKCYSLTACEVWVSTGSCAVLCKDTCFKKKNKYSIDVCVQCDLDTSCPVGYYYEPCNRSVPIYQDGICKPCYNSPPSWISTYTSAAATINVSDCAWVCKEGYYRTGNSCLACDHGSMSPVGALTEEECVQCIPGKYIQQSDFYQVGKTGLTSCQHCVVIGYASVGYGASACTGCGAGFIAAYSRDLLPDGSILGYSACYKCNVGKYSTKQASNNQYDCTACATGMYSPYRNASTCLLCSPGNYSSSFGSVQCNACPSGNYTAKAGSSECAACPAGTYTSITGSTACTTCPTGTYTTKIGSSSCELCNNTWCSAGYYKHDCGGASAGVCSGCTNT